MIDPASLDFSSLPWLPLDARSAFPRQPAVYFAIDGQGSIQYIGISVDPKTRWNQHHRCKQLEAIGGVRIAYLFVEDAALLKPIELKLISFFDPPLNVVGREVPVSVSGRKSAERTERSPTALEEKIAICKERLKFLEDVFRKDLEVVSNTPSPKRSPKRKPASNPEEFRAFCNRSNAWNTRNAEIAHLRKSIRQLESQSQRGFCSWSPDPTRSRGCF